MGRARCRPAARLIQHLVKGPQAVAEEIAEIVGLFLVVAGAVAVVVAAALISTALACIVGGLLAMLAGALVVTIANRSAASKTVQKPSGG